MEIPRRELAFLGSDSGFSVLLKRNCSISPSGLIRVLAVIAAATLGIAAGFAALGAWLVLPFAGLEIAALAAAFLLAGRHAGDYERIERAGARLVVEVADGSRTAEHVLEARGARVCMQREGLTARVLLRTRVGELEIGRHLDAARRIELAAELQERLRN